MMQSAVKNSQIKIVIVGAGPAGASLAIRLAKKDFNVILIERERFPRHKLCGEFISPECFRHFRELEIFGEMIAGGGDRITETVFYAPNGKSISVPSQWFDAKESGALSLSRAEMDSILLKKTSDSGVEVLQETSVSGLIIENETVRGVKIKSVSGEPSEIFADLTIDATGRANVLAKLFRKSGAAGIQNLKPKNRTRLVGFKTHLKNAALEKGRCEIYFFRGGYGGLSWVENDLANHCFLIKSEIVKEFGGDANKIVEHLIFQNERARETMANAAPVFDWLAVSVEGFGRKDLAPAKNLLTVGDAAAFIDPFTGSGMLMALESAEILARAIVENIDSFAVTAAAYKTLHREKFQQRLRICSLVRRAAFVPNFAKLAVSALSVSRTARMFLAHSTRQTLPADKK